mgnify:CR=1 FL=1
MFCLLRMEKRQENSDGISRAGALWSRKLDFPCSEMLAVTHVDYFALIQTFHAVTNPRFHRYFIRTGMDYLVFVNLLLKKGD